jgi:hypothetical protein
LTLAGERKVANAELLPEVGPDLAEGVAVEDLYDPLVAARRVPFPLPQPAPRLGADGRAARRHQ